MNSFPFLLDILIAVVNLFNEMSPYLLLGFFIAGILHVVVPPNFVSRFLGKKNFTSVVNASLLGVPLPLCSCGVIPAGISLHKEGASKGSATSFLISTPQTGVDSLLVTYSIMGLPFALIRPIVALFTGILGGWLVDRFEQDDEKNQISMDNSNIENTKEKKSLWQVLKEMFHYAFVELPADISKWLLVGVLLAALITVFVPENFFTSYLDNPLLSMFLILLVSVPLYVCSTGSVPIAAVLLLKGISPGAAFVFLMAGPATNAATITVLQRSLGKKILFIYLSVIIVASILSGFVIDLFLPIHWFALADTSHLGHSHSLLPMWLVYGSSIFLFLVLLYGLVGSYLFKNHEPQDQQSLAKGLQVLTVEGMDCSHCKASVEKGIKVISGVEEIQANISNGQVVIKGEGIDMDKVKTTIHELGYQVKP